jgi:C4-type Zn-finger protein
MKTKEEIDKAHMNDVCPACGEKEREEPNSELINYGKTMALYFICEHCDFEYTIGYERNDHFVESKEGW